MTFKSIKKHKNFFCKFLTILATKKTKVAVFLKHTRIVLVFKHIFFQKWVICFLNVLKINGFCRSLMDSPLNFRKPPELSPALGLA